MFHPFSHLCPGAFLEVRNTEFLIRTTLDPSLLIWAPPEQLVLCSSLPQVSFRCRLENKGQSCIM